MGYAVFVVDPQSGPDSPTYDAAARDFAADGLLASDVTGIPYWPAGYSILLSLPYRLFDEPRAATSIQVLLFALASYLLYQLLARELDQRVALTSITLLALNPALTAASSEIMYETTLGSGLVIGIDLMSRSVRSSQRNRGLLAIAGIFVLSVTSTLQPKVLVVAAAGIAWLVVRQRKVVLILPLILALATGPGALAARNYLGSDQFVVSTNLGATMAIGMYDGATGGSDVRDIPHCAVQDLAPDERSPLRCSVTWAWRNPAHASWLALKKVMYFSSPLVGPLAVRGTWFHGLDYRRLLPDSIRHAMWFRNIELVAWNLWTALWGLLVLTGVVLAWRNYPHSSVVLLVIPTAAFLLVSMVTIGDPRFRLPVAPFYSAFIAISLLHLLDPLLKRRSSTEQGVILNAGRR